MADKKPQTDHFKEMIEIEVHRGATLSLPKEAFEEGARSLNLIRDPKDPWMGTACYSDSIRAFFSVLKARGVSSIQF